MTAIETRKLRRFFGLDGTGEECRLYLPIFRGPVSLETGAGSPHLAREPALPPGAALRYPGHTFADRDAKAASYVSSVLSRALELDHIRWEEAGAFIPGSSGTAILFGSRSNRGAEWATGESALGRFFRFEFGTDWSITCANGKVFSLPAPNTLSRDEYEKQTDYGVIGRFQDAGTQAHVFLIAGLGSRATEGCGLYLARHWKELAQKFRGKDFAVVLKFPPPIDPKKSRGVVAFDDDHPGGFAPVF